MPEVTQASSRELSAQVALHLFAECETLEKTEAGALDFTTMVLDSSGMVRYCDPEAARLFGASTYMLLGQPIGALIPDLPLKPATPGYNVAYASFHARAGSQRRFSGIHSLGRRCSLDVSLATLKIEGSYHIRLNLRQAPVAFHATTQFAARDAAAGVRTKVEVHA